MVGDLENVVTNKVKTQVEHCRNTKSISESAINQDPHKFDKNFSKAHEPDNVEQKNDHRKAHNNYSDPTLWFGLGISHIHQSN